MSICSDQPEPAQPPDAASAETAAWWVEGNLRKQVSGSGVLVMLVSAQTVLLRPPCMQVACLPLAEVPLLPYHSTASSFVCRGKMPAQAGYPGNNPQEGLWGAAAHP